MSLLHYLHVLHGEKQRDCALKTIRIHYLEAGACIEQTKLKPASPAQFIVFTMKSMKV